MGGSPIYMAPETLIHKRFSFSSDIWALGCILYELFTLQPAFDSVQVSVIDCIADNGNSIELFVWNWEKWIICVFQSMDELIRCTLTQEYPPLNPDIHFCSKEMVALCAHMMNVNVEKRATIKDVIRNPIIVVHYYHSYFRFDAWFRIWIFDDKSFQIFFKFFNCKLDSLLLLRHMSESLEVSDKIESE